MAGDPTPSEEACRGMRRKSGKVNSPSSLELAGTGGWASRSAPPLEAPLPPRGGARGGRGRGRRRAGPGTPVRPALGQRRAGPPRSFPSRDGPGAARCISVSGRRRWRLNACPALGRRLLRADPRPPRSALSSRVRVTVVLPVRMGVSSKLPGSSGCLDCFSYFFLIRFL